jgi:hypothetical protein
MQCVCSCAELQNTLDEIYGEAAPLPAKTEVARLEVKRQPVNSLQEEITICSLPLFVDVLHHEFLPGGYKEMSCIFADQ